MEVWGWSEDATPGSIGRELRSVLLDLRTKIPAFREDGENSEAPSFPRYAKSNKDLNHLETPDKTRRCCAEI
jgi:hypothetical protein